MELNKLNFISKENPTDEEVTELRMSLRSYNSHFSGIYERTHIMHQVRDEDEKLMGGIYGYLSWSWLYIDLLWVDKSLRGNGIGTKLISAIERKANKMGVYRYYLGTTTFQALDFYRKHGYEICGEIEDLPPGYTNYFLKKTEL